MGADARDGPVATRGHVLRDADGRAAAAHGDPPHSLGAARLPDERGRASRPRALHEPGRPVPLGGLAAARDREDLIHGESRHRPRGRVGRVHVDERGAAAALGHRGRLRSAVVAGFRHVRLGVARARPHAAARSRAQDAPPLSGAQRGLGGAVPEGSATGGAAPASRDRPDLRLGAERGRPLVRDGARGRRFRRRPRATEGAATHRGSRAANRIHPRRPHRRAPARHHSPRPEAGERPAEPVPALAHRRLRHRVGAGGRPDREQRNAGVCPAGAIARRTAGRGRRPVRGGGDRVFRAHRTAAVRSRRRSRNPRHAIDREARPDRNPGRTARVVHPQPRDRSGRALSRRGDDA